MEAHHHIAAAWKGQGGGCPPATQLISLQHLKPKLLQVLHLDAQHNLPDFWVPREGAVWDFALSLNEMSVSCLCGVQCRIVRLFVGNGKSGGFYGW